MVMVVFIFIINEMDQPHKIVIVLENQTAYPNTVHVMRQLKSVAYPDYFASLVVICRVKI